MKFRRLLSMGLLMNVFVTSALSFQQTQTLELDQQQVFSVEKDSILKSDTNSLRVVQRAHKNGKLTLSGRIHRVVMLVDDGVSNNGFFMDSDQGPSMLRVDISNKSKKAWTVSGSLEVGIQSNRSFHVNQENPNPGTDIRVIVAEIVFYNSKIGRFSFGRGFAAAWVAPEVDLSGTVPAALLAVGNLAPGMLFVDNSNNDLSSIRVSDHFIDTERLLLTDRFRFDSKKFWSGMQLSGSIAADSRWDAALRFYPEINKYKIRMVVTYQHKPFRDIDHRVDLAFSIRHIYTGFSLTSGITYGITNTDRTAMGYVIKGGWLKKIISLGTTAFSIDYSLGNDILFQQDKAQSLGFFVLQKWNSIGVDFYAGFRNYNVKRQDIDLKPLDIFSLGVMYTF